MQKLVSIVTPPATSALTTLANAKADLGVTTTDDDSYIALLIDRASAIVTAWLGRALGVLTVSEMFRHQYASSQAWYNPYPPGYGASADGQGCRPLVLSYLPVLSITSIFEDANPALTAGVDYEIEPSTGLVWRLAGGIRTPWFASATVVTYSAGYVLPQDSGTRTLPFAIEDATLSLVQQQYFARGIDPTVVLDVVEGVGRTGYNKNPVTGLNEGAKTQLAPYRSAVW